MLMQSPSVNPDSSGTSSSPQPDITDAQRQPTLVTNLPQNSAPADYNQPVLSDAIQQQDKVTDHRSTRIPNMVKRLLPFNQPGLKE